MVGHTANSRADIVGEMFNVLMSVWECRLFSESKWLSKGPVAKTMVATSLTSFSPMSARVRQKPSVSGVFLNGLTPDRFWGL